MKKLFFITALVASVAISPKNAISQVKFGVQAGVNLAAVNLKSGDEKVETKTKVGLIAGVMADMDFGNSISFRPELNFIQKGYELNSSTSIGGFTSTQEDDATFSYIELPLNFVYNVPAGSGSFFFGLGPSFGYGIAGKIKSKSSITGFPTEETTSDVRFDGEEDATDDKAHLKAFDFGANALAGYKMNNGFFVNLGYTFGFANILPGDTDGSSLKHTGLALKIGYMFGGAAAAAPKDANQ